MKQKVIKLTEQAGLYAIAKPIYDSLMVINPKQIRCKKRILDFYSQFISKNDLCFDVGANLGSRTETFLKLGATIVAVEPQNICMRRLQKKYGKNKKVILVQKALGEKKGKGKLMVSNVHVLSSMAERWIKSVKSSGRFSGYKWDKVITVPVTTLDKLIQQYGKPAFCKIDVEGFEEQVLKGLSQPIKALSFEFVPEFINAAINCAKHLDRLGMTQFNYSLGEIPHLALPKWVTTKKIGKILLSLPDKGILGEVYAKNPKA